MANMKRCSIRSAAWQTATPGFDAIPKHALFKSRSSVYKNVHHSCSTVLHSTPISITFFPKLYVTNEVLMKTTSHTSLLILAQGILTWNLFRTSFRQILNKRQTLRTYVTPRKKHNYLNLWLFFTNLIYCSSFDQISPWFLPTWLQGNTHNY